jgi:hypothetical protein
MNKKQIFIVILSWVFISALTAVFGGMPSTIKEFLLGFALCFTFWGCLFFLPVLGEAFEN